MEARQLNTNIRLLLATADTELCLSLHGRKEILLEGVEFQDEFSENFPRKESEGGDERAIFLGRDKHCDLILKGDQVSRVHARIQPEGQYFYLYDTSTNGCFFRGEDEQVTFIRRKSLRLWGQGLISLGTPDFTRAVVSIKHLD